MKRSSAKLGPTEYPELTNVRENQMHQRPHLNETVKTEKTGG